ncbi:hypothetical protein MAPG_11742 [Magnaporthiopsis poae ATCC 64411]|uniref:DUF6594 domain-containing protein n=1 Tax=Magnaporthiopsis poae (strain ATCC 64411 / 73-15) TaxID=644358 RepID=A0A0C4EG27_MAGP6|nr:hypothetical protein MAPG_11742 [Magnaporthiopsis poae ATCC 64411]
MNLDIEQHAADSHAVEVTRETRASPAPSTLKYAARVDGRRSTASRAGDRRSGSFESGRSDARRTEKDIDPNNPGPWAVNYHLNNLLVEVKRPRRPSSEGDGGERRFKISFAEVQRMRIRKLQCKLVRDVVRMRNLRHEVDGWDVTLEQYIKALQDYDYMESRSKLGRDPFVASGEYWIDNYVLNACISSEGHSPADDVQKVDALGRWECEGDEIVEQICGTRPGNLSKAWWNSFRKRATLAGLGGLFLVGPMWLMVLRNSLYTSLISTTAFVTGFGLIMAYLLEEGRDVLASTAAYAAVLVVFVGTSQAGGSATSSVATAS